MCWCSDKMKYIEGGEAAGPTNFEYDALHPPSFEIRVDFSSSWDVVSPTFIRRLHLGE